MKKIIFFIIFIMLVASYQFGVFSKFGLSSSNEGFRYEDNFDFLDEEFWYVGQWDTLEQNNDLVSIEDGIISLEVQEADQGPFLLSKPIQTEYEDVLHIKRRVKIHYANEYFTGGLAILETSDDSLKPSTIESGGLGKGVALVEYVHNYDQNSTRPGRDVFRVLPPTWETSHNYEIIEPIFDKWFDEELIYNTKTGKITYIINDAVYNVYGLSSDTKTVRIFMHSYGQFSGHNIEIDSLEVFIEKASE